MNVLLMGIALKSTVVLGVACVVALVARDRSAAARHLFWTTAVMALLALPVLSVALPVIHLTLLDKVVDVASGPSVTFTAEARAAADSIAKGPSPGAHVPAQKAPWHPDWGLMLATIWTLGAAFGCAQLMLAWAAMRRLRARCGPAPAAEIADLATGLGVRRKVEVLETVPGTMPMTFGWTRPAIFLPADAIEWTADRRRAVLLHELAHIRRGDVATQFLARLARNLYWWNPMAWIAWREFLKMRERAADDLVLEAGTRASDYAGHLLDVARSTTASAQAVAAIAMAQPSELETRLTAILDSSVSRKTPGRPVAAMAVLAAVVVVAPVAAIHAQDQSLPADVDATIRIATGQKNFEMLDRPAEGFIKIRQYDTARKLLEAALTIRGEVAGEHSATYSDGLLKLGDLAWEHPGARPRPPVAIANANRMAVPPGVTVDPAVAAARLRQIQSAEPVFRIVEEGRPSASKDYYEKAVAAGGDRPATAQALLRLGILAFHEPVAAESYLERSINADPKAKTMGEALAWMGAIRDAQGNSAEANSLFARAQSLEQPGSAQAALVAEMYASFVGAHEGPDVAEPIRAPAADFRAAHIASLSPKVTGAASAQRIGGSVAPPTVQSKVEPEYDMEARALKIQGTVTLKVIIGADGSAGNITLGRSLGFGLDEKALAAVSQWHFNPGTQDGVPVPVVATIEVNFRLL